MFYTKNWGVVSCKEEVKMLGLAQALFNRRKKRQERPELIFTATTYKGTKIYWRGHKGDIWTDHGWRDSAGNIIPRSTLMRGNIKRLK